MKKRFTAALCALILCAGAMAGCGDTSGSEPSSAGTTKAQTTKAESQSNDGKSEESSGENKTENDNSITSVKTDVDADKQSDESADDSIPSIKTDIDIDIEGAFDEFTSASSSSSNNNDEHIESPESYDYIKTMYIQTNNAFDAEFTSHSGQYGTMSYLHYGDAVDVYYEHGIGWADEAYINCGDVWGWIRTDYLSDTVPPSNADEVMAPDNYYGNANDGVHGVVFVVKNDGLEMKVSPDDDAETVTALSGGDRLRMCGDNEGVSSWVYAFKDGQFGWVRTCDDSGEEYVWYEVNVATGAKPAIYLYPEKKTDISVKVEPNNARLKTTYPKYNGGWNVTAYPDGTIVNKADGGNYNYLFWDAYDNNTYDMSKGFCVKGEDMEQFLREKLAYMGLNEAEMNEFIVYWLPLTEHNAYNLIAFQTDDYAKNFKLDITPEPDSVLRLFMTYKPLDRPVGIEPQELDTFERVGFTVVEWGGEEIK